MDDPNMISGQPPAETPPEYKPGEVEASAPSAAAPAPPEGQTEMSAPPEPQVVSVPPEPQKTPTPPAQPVAPPPAAEAPTPEAPAEVVEEPKSDKMDWYILKVQSNREESIREGLLRRVPSPGWDISSAT